MREGDIFRWRYKDSQKDRAPYAYHCKSLVAIVSGQTLRDTYWHDASSCSSWSITDAAANLELRFVANFDELKRCLEWQFAYYADADCVNLNHINSSGENFYIRKGAQRCREKMLEMARQNLKRAEDDARFAENRAASAREIIVSIESGDQAGRVLRDLLGILDFDVQSRGPAGGEP